MKRTLLGLTAVLTPIFASGSIQAQTHRAVTIAARHFAVSEPLRDLAPAPEAASPDAAPILAGLSKTINLLDFNGVADGNFAYPDANGAVGATQFMQWTNSRYAVYSKATGALIVGPVGARTLWTKLGGPCASSTFGDGIINYDKAANQWVVTHHAGTGVPFLQCVAISTTSDATGSYFLYDFELTSTAYPDYNQIGVWTDAYYLTANLLSPINFTNVTGLICALDRANMSIGNPAATAQCFTATTNAAFSVLQPADLDGATPPPAGSPNYLLALNTNSLDLYKFHVDWLNPVNSTLTGPVNIPVEAFTQACFGGFCIPQSGTTQVLDGVGDRLLHRLAYRNFGDHEALVVTHSVAAGTSVGVRWYEIRSPGTTPVVFQQGTQAPDANFRWIGSIAMDHTGNIALGYSISNSTMFPGIRFAGRVVSDPLGQLESEASIFMGFGAQTHPGNNWGNASSLTVDPVDDCTFWYTNEYMKLSGVAWNTRIGAFKFKSCR